ncbi:MAG: cupredoxin family copper-binding protein [Candidatus Aenigmarchaeota archaeon]|nr:cupredoxin family copper-binding protein [Candidatus Aenigmarchaeota archaeon]
MKNKTIIGIALLLLLAACAKQQVSSSETVAETLADFTVTIKNFKFVPDMLTVKEGQTIKWVNEDDAIHTVEANNNAFASPELFKGDSWTFTFNKKGAYEYICGIHPTMKGKVVVE